MKWTGIISFAVVPVEVQAILQEKKNIINKLKYYLSIVSDSFGFVFPAGWLSELDFDLQKTI